MCSFTDDLYLDYIKGESFLEAGCGEGHLMAKLRQKPDCQFVASTFWNKWLGAAKNEAFANLSSVAEIVCLSKMHLSIPFVQVFGSYDTYAWTGPYPKCIWYSGQVGCWLSTSPSYGVMAKGMIV